jgi:hypothetical protein
MSVVVAEPKRDTQTQGARSLYQACLDRSASIMLDNPDSVDLITELPGTIQKDLWILVLGDRRDRQAVSQELAQLKSSIPLMDRELHLGIDNNRDFLRSHAEPFGDERTDELDDPEASEDDNHAEGSDKDNIRLYYDSADDLQRMAFSRRKGSTSPRLARDRGPHVYLVENSSDSLMRFSICTTFSPGSQPICTHAQHFRLDVLISPQLAKSRMDILWGHSWGWAPGTKDPDYGKGQNCTVWEHGDVTVVIDDEVDILASSLECRFSGDMSVARSDEIALNALLSPIELSMGENEARYNFAIRYMKVLVPSVHYLEVVPLGRYSPL